MDRNGWQWTAHCRQLANRFPAAYTGPACEQQPPRHPARGTAMPPKSNHSLHAPGLYAAHRTLRTPALTRLWERFVWCAENNLSEPRPGSGISHDNPACAARPVPLRRLRADRKRPAPGCRGTGARLYRLRGMRACAFPAQAPRSPRPGRPCLPRNDSCWLGPGTTAYWSSTTKALRFDRTPAALRAGCACPMQRIG